ncbi:YgjV family protein [Methylobacterium sp. 37f]|uniref:YgjV family protein n=1 Tax=Methylobacterium sp. 37f TaxID=2817058 RepID=UPI001FFDA478|nr:YgjV family protein [Methylobacterium sp. 37f]MCK2054449.1 YgjV family protein [Methylobacterium sp. 37f]
MAVTLLAQSLWDAAKFHLDLFGTLGLLLGFIAGIMPHRHGMLLASAACAACFGLHYLHLGALTGTAMCGIALLQNLVSVQAVRPTGRAAWVAPLFAATTLMAASLTVITWNGWPSACAGLGTLLATAARLQGDPQAMRRFFVGASLCWAGHNLLVSSVFGLTCDLLTLSGLGLSLARHHFRRPDTQAHPVAHHAAAG